MVVWLQAALVLKAQQVQTLVEVEDGCTHLYRTRTIIIAALTLKRFEVLFVL